MNFSNLLSLLQLDLLLSERCVVTVPTTLKQQFRMNAAQFITMNKEHFLRADLFSLLDSFLNNRFIFMNL